MKNDKINFTNAFAYKVIYAFTVNDELHKGLIKIGDATLYSDLSPDKFPPNCKALNQAALKRIKQYTNTVGIIPNLLHTELAVRTIKDKQNNINMVAFRDHDVHSVLEHSGIKKVKIDETTGREWFEISIQTVIDAIDAVKKNYANLSNISKKEFTPIVFRPEQKDAITRTVKQFKKNNRMLWNAKMRFGKTLSALEVIKRCKYEKTIILTHRPVVNAGWYEDFGKIFYDRDYIYGSKLNGYSLDELLSKNEKFVYFASIQDLRGSEAVGGKYNKNNAVFDTVWDLVIVDEAHEGTKTALGDDTIKAIIKEENNKTKLLALSGTPFNILDEYDEKSIYTWDYIKEQECKSEWDKQHFGDSNPYEELPELRIYTYDLGDLLKNKNYITYEDKAFNFSEFFRTWTGEFNRDYAQMPQIAKIGDFVHEEDVWSFLNLMTKTDEKSSYPYSKDEYRELFKHSLWMVPGVKEAKALKELMLKHPVFGCGQFNIVNVAGNDDEESVDALNSVRKAISSAEKVDTYTITLSCGKLTTGVTVKEWTAVFMLAGSFSTSAANYLQTIFRVQSPCNKNGRIKTTAYVFDFAPDRTLKMVSEAVSVSSKAGKANSDDKKILGKFLNYCPVISVAGSKMQEYKADKLLQQLKRAYADKVVRNGFDDNNLYNDELLKLSDIDIEEFNKLKGIIGKSKAAIKQNDIAVNNQGLTNEEYEELEKIKKKPKKELSKEEIERLEELKKKKKVRNDAISILRGISIRMPLLIYGADIPYDEEITLDRFVEEVDDSSWDEFMPNGVTKKIFADFRKYYDEDIFIAAGRRIRNIAREADTLNPTQRVKKIASLFANFKNPDKETVLTPWRVVNMHMSDCLGGYDFFDEKHENTIDEPRFLDRGKVTKDTFANVNAKILEINSKTGLYPLYVSYSIYRAKCKLYQKDKLSFDKKREIWNEVIQNNVFVICKTPMAKKITQRTLAGYSKVKINAHYFDDLINQLKNKPQQFIDRVLKPSYWKKGDIGQMKFDAIVGNPPYMEMDGGAQASAKPIYQHFVMTAKKLNPNYLSFIMPTRWYSGGKGLDNFRDEMLNDMHIEKLFDCLSPDVLFPNTNIRGGVCYFLRNINFDGNKEMSTVVTMDRNKDHIETKRPLKVKDVDIFIRYSYSISILDKVFVSDIDTIDKYISSRKPFGLDGKFIKSKDFYEASTNLLNPVLCYGKSKTVGYTELKNIKTHTELIDKWKVMVPYANNIGTELNDDNLNAFVVSPNSVCTETYIIIGIGLELDKQMCEDLVVYLKTKFARFMLSLAKNSQHATAKTYRFVPMQDFTSNSDIDWDKSIPEIDKQLYKKYNLSEDEIKFIEEKIKPME